MNMRGRNTRGFTIVELLIVIVVIAILAAITVVAYNGIQNRANDTAIQSDLQALAKKVMLHYAEHGSYLPGGSATNDSTKFPGMTFSPSKNAYDLSISNLSYCLGEIGGQVTYAIRAKSKSGNVYAYTPSGLQSLGVIGLGGQSSACTGMTSGTTSYSYGYNPGPTYGWFSWTNG